MKQHEKGNINRQLTSEQPIPREEIGVLYSGKLFCPSSLLFLLWENQTGKHKPPKCCLIAGSRGRSPPPARAVPCARQCHSCALSHPPGAAFHRLGSPRPQQEGVAASTAIGAVCRHLVLQESEMELGWALGPLDLPGAPSSERAQLCFIGYLC